MANDNERSDISLCFQALGIEFGAPPEDVEKAYQRMLAEIKKKSASADPAKKAEAATDLELAHDLYEKIRSSVTYNTTLKEAEATAAKKASQIKKEPAAQQYKICPSCKKTIGVAFKKCPFCREPIRTPFEMLIHKIFSGKILAVIIILLLAIAAAVVFITNPNLFKKPKAAPAADIQSNSILGNLSGSTQKP